MTTPAPEIVARAITAACAETGAIPLAVIRGDMDPRNNDNNFPTSRARAYAGFALQRLHPNCLRREIALLVGASPAASRTFFASVELAVRRGTNRWFSEDVLARVIEATQADDKTDADYSPDYSEAAPAIVPESAPTERKVKRVVAPPIIANRLELGYVDRPAATRSIDSLRSSCGSVISTSLARRAEERRTCQDILAEAARNTAAMARAEDDA